MMNINSMDGMKMQMGQKSFLGKSMDSVEKNIQNQIGNAQKQLQELSSNKEMSMEEKMEKRQEIQEQINDLNKQLRQHQIDQRKEMQNTKSPSTEDMLGSRKKAGNSKEGKNGAGLSQAGMEAMISADSAMSQAKNLKGVATQMKGQRNVLAMEIKLDAQRGRDVGAKQKEMEDLEERIMKTEASQISVMGTAKKEMEETAKAEQQAEKTEDGKEKKTDKAEEANTNAVPEKNAVDMEKETPDLQPQVYYTKIDVRL